MNAIWIAIGAGGAIVLVIALVMMGRRGERVIDSGPVVPEPAGKPPAAAKVKASGGASYEGPGEILEARGAHDAESGLADWLMADIDNAVGMKLNGDQIVIQRVADAALKAAADLKETGRAVVELPYIAAAADGPRNYRREIAREEAEVGMVEHGILLVDELLQWRGRDARTVALGGWLEMEADEQLSSGGLAPAATQRVADAAEKAIVDIDRTGHADVDLPGLTGMDGEMEHLRRAIDRAALERILSE
jgi:hypothetical protein